MFSLIFIELSESSQSWNRKSRYNNSNIDNRLPVTIVTGMLGSGKTTLISRILHNTIGMKILVIENEIGKEGIDHELLFQDINKEDVILLNNGCVCCTVRQDIIKTFHKLFQDETFSNLDWIVIETTGLANPEPLMQTLYMDIQCNERMRLDGVLTLVDAKHIPHHIDSSNFNKSSLLASHEISEVIQQIIHADRILLNKVDLVSSNELESIKNILRSLNQNSDIFTCSYSNINIDDILNIRAFDPLRLKLSSKSTSFTIALDSNGKILKEKQLLGSQSNNSIQTISLVSSYLIDFDKFNNWMNIFLQNDGNDIFRIKGILYMNGYEGSRFVAHGVHMIFDGMKQEIDISKEQDIDDNTNTTLSYISRLVIIGRDLDKQLLEEEFDFCLVKDNKI